LNTVALPQMSSHVTGSNAHSSELEQQSKARKAVLFYLIF